MWHEPPPECRDEGLASVIVASDQDIRESG